MLANNNHTVLSPSVVPLVTTFKRHWKGGGGVVLVALASAHAHRYLIK